MKRIALTLIAAALLAAACDKIEPNADGNYATYSGSVATWSEGTPIANPVQNAYVEKYTGPTCTNCPSADRTLSAQHQQHGNRLVLISVNTMNNQFGAPAQGDPDMRTDDGAVWETFLGVTNFPSGYLNRTGAPYTSDMANIAPDITATLGQQPTVALEGTVRGTEHLFIDINLQLIANIENPITLTLALTQDSLRYLQVDGNQIITDYAHNHMLRDVITDPWGADIECTGAAGECRKATFEYSLPDGINTNYHIVALVCDKATHRVINSIQCE